MSITAAVPRQIVKLGLRGLRLPLSITEHVTERAGFDVSTLPVVAAYDSVEAQAKKVIGQLIGDDQLFDEGDRQEESIRRRAAARNLADQASQVREEAEEELAQRTERAERSRAQVQRRTEERREEIRRHEEEAKREAREKARQREAAVRQAAKVKEKALRAKERQADLARIKAESEALEKEGEAVQAEQVVTAMDEHLEGRRRAGSSSR